MRFCEKLVAIRKDRGFSQEGLAERLGVSRQAIGKWENGLGCPDIDNLIGLSKVFGVTVDQLIKDEGECGKAIVSGEPMEVNKVKEFLIKAKRNTYAANKGKCESCRTGSMDFRYEEGEFVYLDSYLGSEEFIGEEAVWQNGRAVWGMNYCGRVTGEHFSGEFLDEALLRCSMEIPYRGPLVYQNGKYVYHCKVDGDFEWYHGCEEIYYDGKKIYECYFHGSKL